MCRILVVNEKNNYEKKVAKLVSYIKWEGKFE